LRLLTLSDFHNLVALQLFPVGGVAFDDISTFVDDVAGPGGGDVTPVPESATWLMTVGGFGLVGAAMRAHRRIAVGFPDPARSTA
jgi:hypothetical protein